MWGLDGNVSSDDVCIIDHNWWQMRMSDKWHLTSSTCKSSASHQVFLWWLVSLFFVEGKSWHVVTSRDMWKTTSWQCCDSFVPLLWLAGVLVLSKKKSPKWGSHERKTPWQIKSSATNFLWISRDGRSISILALLGFQAAGGSRIQSLLDLAQTHRESLNPQRIGERQNNGEGKATPKVQYQNDIKTCIFQMFVRKNRKKH